VPSIDYVALAQRISEWAQEVGFQACSIAGVDLSHEEAGLVDWLAKDYHGEMEYMVRHGLKRARPKELVPGTASVISVRMNYTAPHAKDADEVMADHDAAFISRYALGRDYHKVLRSKLQQLAERIQTDVGDFGYRVFTDSAPVMEVALANSAGLGWRGKHTLLLSRDAGSMFFLGELFTDLPLAPTEPVTNHCGSCTRCITACPTNAIIAPYLLDARRCISYLTIELKGSIPVELRPLLGNRIYGCDDCQLVCPWNKYAQLSAERDFDVRNDLDDVSLLTLFAWTEEEFNRRFEGSAIRRIGHVQWLRNIAVALGNALAAGSKQSDAIRVVLNEKLDHQSEVVRDHVVWALSYSV
jgi:epoxyqueuosine reductase